MNKTFLLSLLTIALINVSCVWASGQGVSFSGETVTMQHCVGQTISGLEASHMFHVDLSYGTENSVEVTTNKELVEYLEVSVDDGTLTLKLKNDSNREYNDYKK